MFPYYFIRFSGPLLFVLIGLKTLSGYAVTGKMGGAAWLSALHTSRTFDFFLLFLVIFHACYGLRLFLIDLGWVKRERLLFWAFTVMSAMLFGLSYLAFF